MLRSLLLFLFGFAMSQTEFDDTKKQYQLDPGIDAANATPIRGKLTFRPLLHQPRIYAGAPPGVHVTTIHAYDPERPRKKVEYSLMDTLDYKNFVIDQISGNITTARPIDKETNETYDVMVAAISSQNSYLEHLQIVVTEFNQHAPRFEKRNYTVDVHPVVDFYTTILKVKASDPDAVEENAEIYYKMDQNITTKYFELNYITGDLILALHINETKSSLCFGIFAEDGGSPKRWDYVPIYIQLKNITAPLNVQVLNISYSSASVCWEEPLYGDVLGYTISYRSVTNNVTVNVNVAIDYDVDVCRSISMLEDDTEYLVQVYGWNEYEKGKLSSSIYFKTLRNWCKSLNCENGLCKPLSEEPWYICQCLPGRFGSRCEFFNPCVSNPCGTNGRCHNTTDNKYTCICDEDYFGRNCDTYNPCEQKADFCENGGICKTTPDKKLACVCKEGFGGPNCNLRNPCFKDSCANGGTCQFISSDTFKCICPPEFQGEFCQFEIDNCEPNPCSIGSTCISNRQNYTCICPAGYIGFKCTIQKKCFEEETYTMDNWHQWNTTGFGSMMMINCPYGAIDSLGREGFIKRRCILINNEAVWGDTDASECKTKEIILAEEIAIELHNITKNPESLNADTIEAGADGIVTVATHSTDKKTAQGVMEFISKVLEVNDTVLEETDRGTFDSLLESIDILTSNVEMEPGERFDLKTENVRIESIEWHPDTDTEMYGDHIEFSAPMIRGTDVEDEESKATSTISPKATEDSQLLNVTSAKSFPNITEATVTSSNTIVTGSTEKPRQPAFQVFVPKEALEEAHRKLEKNVRIKFVVYYSNKLFQPKRTRKPTEVPVVKEKKQMSNESVQTNEVPIKVPVLQISVGNVAIQNLQKPLVYIIPMTTKRKASCVFWNEQVKEWSIEGLETEQSVNKVICRSSHMTAFSVLLDLTPDVKISEIHSAILSIMSYVGSSMSIAGLIVTLMTYSMFKCLNRDHTGQILINMCISLLMMNISFLMGSSSLIKTKEACAIIAISIHYFVLASLSWMCVEAVNMHQLLVHVFASSETHFMLKRFCIAWGLPLIIASGTAIFKFDAYRRNPDACVMSSYYPWIYYSTFMAPCCLLLFVNLVVFLKVSRVLFTPKLTVKASQSRNTMVTAAQVRGAFTVMILLGITWVFGTLAFGRAKVVFFYIFSITNSLQGFLIFIVRCFLYPEARHAWIYLFRTGKFKRHRGVLPPGTVSYNSNSGIRSGLSPNTTVRSASTDDNQSSEQKDTNRVSKIQRHSPRTISFRYKDGERHPNFQRYVRRSPVERIAYWSERNENFRRENLQRNNRSDIFEMHKKCDKNKEYDAFKWRHPHEYKTESYFISPYNQRKAANVACHELFSPVAFEKVKMKKKLPLDTDTNKDDLSRKFQSPRKHRNRPVDMPSIFVENRDCIPDAVCSNIHKGERSIDDQHYSPDHLIRQNTIFGSIKSSSTKCPSTGLRRKHAIKEKGRNDRYSLDVDEGVHSDNSSITDVEDGLSCASRQSTFSRNK